MFNLQWDFLNYVASLLLSGITSLGLGIFVLLKNRNSNVNRFFFLYSLAITIWAFAQSTTGYNSTLSMIGGRVEHAVICLIAVFYFHFVTVLTNRPHKRTLRFAYIVGAIFSILGASSTTIVKSLRAFRVSPTWLMSYSIEPGSLYKYYFAYFVVVVAYSVFLLYKEYRVSSGAKRNQLKYMLVASVVGYLGGGLNFCYVFKIYVYPLIPYATYTVPIYVFIATYAIVKHKLMDIKVALGRTGLLLLIYGLIIYTSFQSVAIFQPYLEKAFGKQWVYVPIAMYTILISLAPFLYLYIQRKMEDKIFKKQRQYQKTLKQLSAGMTRLKNLYRLLDLTVIQILRTVRVTHATIFLYNKDTNKYILRASRGRFKKEIGLELEPNNLLVAWLFDARALVVYDEIDEYIRKADTQAVSMKVTDIKHLRLIMKQLDAAICVPGFIEERLIGFLVLGEKLSGEIYTQEDLDAFATLTNQAVLAIDNAQSYEELMNTRDQLIKAEKLATLGEFASEVAHEIKNPLQSIKTFTELITEKYDDRNFREKFSKLVATEINRIDNFVRQLIRVAHPLPPKLSIVDMNEVLNSVLELMENDLVSKNILVKKQYEARPVRITADKDQLKQVFLNLITNAIDAMESSEKRILTVSTSSFHSRAIVKITDTGCGIPPESIPHLFNPLFTTKEKGSGLGLSIVDTIIKNHKGKIDVESKVGEGTTFTITI